jgi:hypothetical protein
MISTSAKIFGLLTTHIHNCNDNDCCVRELADQLFDDKNSSVDHFVLSRILDQVEGNDQKK